LPVFKSNNAANASSGSGDLRRSLEQPGRCGIRDLCPAMRAGMLRRLSAPGRRSAKVTQLNH
jgi:hypothetical protein